MLFSNKFETPNKTNIYSKYFTLRSSEGKIIIKIIKKEGDKIRGHIGDQNLRCLDEKGLLIFLYVQLSIFV